MVQSLWVMMKPVVHHLLHDGTFCNLTEVRYIPDLKKNLISVGFLESKGFKITMENGILKVSYGALVALTATCKRNMYFLNGSIIVGGATTTSDITREVTLAHAFRACR